MDNGPRSVRPPIALTIALTIALLAASPSTLPATAAATEQADELVLTLAASGNGATVVQGYLNGIPGTSYEIKFFSSGDCEQIGTEFGSSTHTTDGSGHIAFTSSVDAERPPGDEAITATDSEGSLISCLPLLRDSAPPTVNISELPTFQTETSFPITWGGSDQTEVRFHVLFRQAGFDGGFGDEEALVTDTTATSEAFSGKSGRTYCFRILARDLLNNTSSTGQECTAILLDDASMKHRKGFKQRTGGDHFMGTFSSARVKGATLILSKVQVDQLAILIDRCKRCGKVRVTFPGVKRTVSLKGRKDTQVLVLLADLDGRKGGALRVKSMTDRPVRVDGAGTSAV